MQRAETFGQHPKDSNPRCETKHKPSIAAPSRHPFKKLNEQTHLPIDWHRARRGSHSQTAQYIRVFDRIRID